jgi:hypothetical protein
MLTQFIVWLNAIATLIGRVLFAPIAWLPGWLSATIVAVVTGVVMLLVFKHTSNQAAIKRVRNQINANLLSLSLFKDNMSTSLRAQGRILFGAGKLLVLALVPTLVMLVPMSLLLGQLALWYQARPLTIGEESIVSVHLRGTDSQELQLQASGGFETTAGPVHVPAEQMVCWRIVAKEPGQHELSFAVDGNTVTKELAVGNGYMPVSLARPEWNWSDALLNPRESPLAPATGIASIEIDYPRRESWTSGTNWWLAYLFAVSLAAAFAVRPLLKVNI